MIFSEQARDLVARATLGSHLAFTGMWYVLFIAYFLAAMRIGWGNGMAVGVALPLAGGFASSVWLLGFKIELSNGVITYRDGLYRTSSTLVSEVRLVKSAWVSWKTLGRTLSAPRLLVYKHGEKKPVMQINAKPFSRDAIAAVTAIGKSRAIGDKGH